MPDFDQPHRRFNPLTGEWVLVSPHRTKRPWQGRTEKTDSQKRPSYLPDCYLCPGNKRANGVVNPDYKFTYVFNNDFAALLPGQRFWQLKEHDFLKAESIEGTCRVLCFSPRHDLTLAEMEIEAIERVIDLWIENLTDLGKTYRWVQIFENKGEIMGCSNPHPHGQIWAGNFLPSEPQKEDVNQKNYFRRKNSVLLLDYLDEELKREERIVLQNEHWVVLVPFWAVWPFETLLLPRKLRFHLHFLESEEKKSLAEIIKKLLTRYDNLFRASFPYTMGWHGAPFGAAAENHWQLHAHFYPPLLRSANVKKFMVGYEMLAEAQRDFTAEQAARRLQTLSDVHFGTEVS